MGQQKALEVVVKQELGILNWNFEELNAQLDAQLEKYRGLTFTDDQMADAKKTRAALNKVAKEINDRKVSVKNEFCEPYFKFEEQAKILIGKIKDTSGEIDAQIKSYEEHQKEEKRKRIEEWWAEHGMSAVQVEKVFDPKYLNQTCTDKQWQDDLQEKRTRIGKEIEAINQMFDENHPEKPERILTYYLMNLDVGTAVMRWDEELKAKERAEEEMARREAERQAVKETPRVEAVSEPQEEPEQKADDPNDWLYSPTFKCIDMTYRQAMRLTQFFKSENIRFQSLDKQRRKK